MAHPPNRKYIDFPRTLSPFKGPGFSQVPIKQLVLDVNENLRHLKKSPLDIPPFQSLNHQEAKQILGLINYLSHRLISQQVKHQEIMNHIEKLKSHISEKNNQIDQVRKNLKTAERETNFHAKENQSYKTKMKKIQTQIATLSKKNDTLIQNEKKLQDVVKGYELEQESIFREIQSRQEVYLGQNPQIFEKQKETLQKMAKQSSSSEQWKPKTRMMPVPQTNSNIHPTTKYQEEQEKEDEFCKQFEHLLQDYKAGQIAFFEKQNRQYKQLLIYIKQFQKQQVKLIKSDQMTDFMNLVGVPLEQKQVFIQKLERSQKLAKKSIFRAYQTSHQVFFKLFKYLLTYASGIAKKQLPYLDDLVRNYDDSDHFEKTKQLMIERMKKYEDIEEKENLLSAPYKSKRYHELNDLHRKYVSQLDEYNKFLNDSEEIYKQFRKKHKI